MIEIKFRGFHECRNGKSKAFYKGKWHKGEWVCGDLIHNLYLNEENPATEIATLFESHRVDDSTVGQYTGLTDRNGRQIYVGDILHLTGKDTLRKYDWKAVVEFGNPNGLYNWGFQLKPITDFEFNTDTLLWVGMEEIGVFCEIIGNIYENPELLKEDEK